MGIHFLNVLLMLLLSVMEYGMMKANKNLKCGIWLVPDLCTNIVKAFILVMQSQKNGKHWEKVNMDIVPGTNIVDTCDRDAATVWLDKMCPEPEKTFQTLQCGKT